MNFIFESVKMRYKDTTTVTILVPYLETATLLLDARLPMPEELVPAATPAASPANLLLAEITLLNAVRIEQAPLSLIQAKSDSCDYEQEK